MKPLKPHLAWPAILGCALTPSALHAQTVTVLESFENGLDNVVVVGGGNRPVEDIQISEHTKTGDDDPAVTDGETALKITLTTNYGWNTDADVILSEEASNLVKQAWASQEEARYLIRYDVTFPTENVNWGNLILHVNGWDYAQLEQGGGSSRSMSIPLDLVTSDLSAEERVTLRIVDQYGVEDGTESIEVFVDNFRLIDTYAPGAVPEITLLNGFETEEDVARVVPVSDRYTASLHTRTGPDDLAVTEGDGSLEITVNANGGWTRDFTVPFKGTIMETIARIPQEDRLRYTLRFDAIFADASGENWDGNWQNVVVRTAGGGAQQFAMHRGGGDQHVRTYSAPLDQIILEPGDPGNPDDPNPGISFVSQGAWNDSGMTMHYDNFRLIDTGKTPLQIRDLVINDEGQPVISWASSPSQAYGIEVSEDLNDWSDLVTDILGQPGSEETSYVDTAATLEGTQHYRVFVSGAAPPLNEDFENGLNGWTAVEKDTNSGSTSWEVGEPTNGPDAAHGGVAVAGTGIDADYTDGSHIALQSPVASLAGFIAAPTLSFAYFLDIDGDSAARINILDEDGNVIDEGDEDNGRFFFGPMQTDGWVQFSQPLPFTGQKVVIEFEFVDGAGDGTNGAGFFVDDVLIRGND